NRAVSLLAEKKAGGGRRFGEAQVLATLGNHPDGEPVTVRSGRYGPYVNHGKVNATLPRGKTAETITLPEALDLLAAKAAAPARPGRKAPARSAAKAKPAKAAAKPAAKAAKPAARRKTTKAKAAAEAN